MYQIRDYTMVEAIVNLGDVQILRSMAVDILLRFGVVVE